MIGLQPELETQVLILVTGISVAQLDREQVLTLLDLYRLVPVVVVVVVVFSWR